jgi:branched-chain amino acid transport system ATP-binding protein
MALLETRELTVTYGGLNANDQINIRVDEGKLVGLIGPNGAGKTTFIDAITGFTKPSSGVTLFDDREINALTPAQRADLGLVRTFQSLELFEDLTVWDNMLAVAERPKWWSFLADMVVPKRKSDVAEQAAWALDMLGLGAIRGAMPTDLSHGQRKLVSVARGLAAKPRLLLLDEPAAGLDTAESQILGRHLRDFLGHMTVFLIDHDMGLVLNVCDYLYVLDFGRIIAEGTPAEIRSNPAVVAAYLGESAGEMQMEGAASIAHAQESDVS